ncbi:CBS domain-containing protein [Streptomyces albus subsp. chlorinus]|uniref:CBS domain-containing protein n=1 Tax=Streptomyces albus TaxID=1888 RepID=UPI0015712B7F|nr:CBS domain-containing protein [Streptomyces albus]NSC25281.1 CBS domain-containing protein [Streptomyces albus subsp. chlorinus]
MAHRISEIMTADPITVEPETAISEVARLMRDEDFGEVLVSEEDHLRGVVTDRDLVVRALADARDVDTTSAQDVCSGDVVTCAPDAEIDDAVRLMRENAVRRLPVVDGDELVGTVTMGDIALQRDPNSALADVSSAQPNR